ncbi:RAI1-domain-containing protein [Mycena alexandri]|uniref:Decapping nuclease n=1 Tax=Mycena alexandri TaxID=1745969 RepID=A0AAD6SPT7_9AGAR|nr:RAI1-domain-containing protein [Mycena alexandri]
MSKRNLSDLLNGDADAEPGPSTKQRRRSPTPSPPLPAPQTLAYPALDSPPVTATPFQRPTQIISFSYSPERELQFNDDALRYLASPPPRAQLAHGYDRWVRRPERRPRIDSLLRALSAGRQKQHPALASGVGAVAWRGVLTRILTAPYEEREGWEMNVMCVDGVLYFEEHLSDARLREKNDIAPRHRIQTYFGYSFESYCTSAVPSPNGGPSVNVPQAPGDPPGWGGDVDTNVQWCSVVRTKLGATRLVIGGEVDCVRGKYTGATDTFVELKTSMAIRGPQDEARFEKKLLKFYLQSFLLGVPEILVGFRTPAGELTTTQTFRTTELPRLVRGKKGAWDPRVCLGWGEAFLEFVKEVVGARGQENGASKDEREAEEQNGHAQAHPDAAVWRVSFRPNTGVELVRLDAAGVRDVERRGGDKQDDEEEEVERVGFLPRWYWEEVTGKSENKSNGEGT